MADELDLLYNDEIQAEYSVPTVTQPQAAPIKEVQQEQKVKQEEQQKKEDDNVKQQKQSDEVQIEFAHDFTQDYQRPQANITLANEAQRLDDAPPTTALYISDLQWWATDNDIVVACLGPDNLEQEHELILNIQFLEHKINGKSKGVAYVEFVNPDIAASARQQLSRVEFSGKRAKTSFVHPSQIGRPFESLPLGKVRVSSAQLQIDSMEQVAISNPTLIPTSKQSHHGSDTTSQYERGGYRPRGGRGSYRPRY